MDIVVHGTKGGCDIFTPQKKTGLFDVGLGAGVACLGQHAYSISFKDDNKILSKYLIIKDVRGDKRTGFIAYSLFLPNNKKLAGIDIISLLDKVSDKYQEDYIKDNNLYDVREDWTFLDIISSEYEEKLKLVSSDNVESLQSGNKDAAYIYYNTLEELQKYFDAPYQQEYTPFKLVFFIIDDLKNRPENPLNALRHGSDPFVHDLTGKIDLENQFYKLREYHEQAKNNVLIEIRVNGRVLHNKDKIFKKDYINIRYSKNKYYKEIREEGKITDLEIAKYIHVYELDGRIEVEKDVDLQQVEKVTNFEFNYLHGSPESYAEIQIWPKPWQMVFGNRYEYTFKGEELKDRCTVNGRNGLFSGCKIFIPEDSPDKIFLELTKSIKLTFIVSDDKAQIFDYNVQIRDKWGTLVCREKEFIINGESITDSFDITISSRGCDSENFKYLPEQDENPKHVKLRNKQYEFVNNRRQSTYETKYPISINEKCGKKSHLGKPIPEYVQSQPNFGCDARFGYEFRGWRYSQERLDDRFDGYYEAIFKEVWYHKLLKWYWIASFIITALVSCFLIMDIPLKFRNSESQQISSDQIKKYIEGDSLLLDTLKSLNQSWDAQKPDESKRNFKEWNNIQQLIKKAISLRGLISDGDFEKLKKETYYPQQMKFQQVIVKIDSADSFVIRKHLSDLSQLTLIEITNKINNILDSIRNAKETNQELIENAQDRTPSVREKVSSKSNIPSLSTKEQVIIHYLMGNELKMEQLKNFKKEKEISKDIMNSVLLCMEFWQLDGRGTKTYEKYQQKIRNNKILNSSKLSECVTEMITNHYKYEEKKKKEILNSK